MRVPIDPFLISGDPRRCIRRTTGDCRGCQSSLWDPDVVGAEIGEVFILLCFGYCGRLWLGGRSSLCRCTLAIYGCHPRQGSFRVGARLCQFVVALFGKPSSERVVGVCPNLGAVAS